MDCDCSKKEFNELIQLLKFQTNIVSLNPPENIWTDEEGKAPFMSLALDTDKLFGHVSQSHTQYIQLAFCLLQILTVSLGSPGRYLN